MMESLLMEVLAILLSSGWYLFFWGIGFYILMSQLSFTNLGFIVKFNWDIKKNPSFYCINFGTNITGNFQITRNISSYIHLAPSPACGVFSRFHHSTQSPGILPP